MRSSKGFVVALNRLLEGKTTVISNLESLSSVLFDTSEMETTVVKLKAEMELVQEMIQKAHCGKCPRGAGPEGVQSPF